SIAGLTSAVGALDTVRTRRHLLTSATNGETQAAIPHPQGPQRPTIRLRHRLSAARGLAQPRCARSHNKTRRQGQRTSPQWTLGAGLSTLLRSVPDCPNTAAVRQTLYDVLAEVGLPAANTPKPRRFSWRTPGPDRRQ